MRNECDKLQDAISCCRQFLTLRFDALTEERIDDVIADLERRAALEGTRGLHLARARQRVVDIRYPHQI
jgi:hypothetical protein